MTSTDYVKAALETVSKQLEKRGVKFPSRVSTPIAAGYTPETNTTPELNSDDVTHFQELIGIYDGLWKLGGSIF